MIFVPNIIISNLLLSKILQPWLLKAYVLYNDEVMLTVYIIAISFITFACFGIDKWKAVNHKWRISEATLIGLCLIGGSAGGLTGMLFFCHKTKKPLFFAGIPVIFIIQIIVLAMLYKRFR